MYDVKTTVYELSYCRRIRTNDCGKEKLQSTVYKMLASFEYDCSSGADMPDMLLAGNASIVIDGTGVYFETDVTP